MKGTYYLLLEIPTIFVSGECVTWGDMGLDDFEFEVEVEISRDCEVEYGELVCITDGGRNLTVAEYELLKNWSQTMVRETGEQRGYIAIGLPTYSIDHEDQDVLEHFADDDGDPDAYDRHYDR